jgi:hypothetical protein
VLGRRVSELSQSIAVQQAKIMSEKIKWKSFTQIEVHV